VQNPGLSATSCFAAPESLGACYLNHPPPYGPLQDDWILTRRPRVHAERVARNGFQIRPLARQNSEIPASLMPSKEALGAIPILPRAAGLRKACRRLALGWVSPGQSKRGSSATARYHWLDLRRTSFGQNRGNRQGPTYTDESHVSEVIKRQAKKGSGVNANQAKRAGYLYPGTSWQASSQWLQKLYRTAQRNAPTKFVT
jgi:hypothetical protein